MNRYADWALAACESDTVIIERFFKVNGLIDPPLRLLHPSFVFRVATANLRRRQQRAPVTAASEAAL